MKYVKLSFLFSSQENELKSKSLQVLLLSFVSPVPGTEVHIPLISFIFIFQLKLTLGYTVKQGYNELSQTTKKMFRLTVIHYSRKKSWIKF